VIGLLPAELQLIATISAGVTTGARQPEGAKAFVRHLTAPAAMAIYKSKGLAL
jgi:ABC-type molybdate transport system substrate-binding protein